MKRTGFRIFPTISLVLVAFLTVAQEATIDKEFKSSSIESLCKLMNDYYVFPEVAKKTETHLKKQLTDGYFNEHNDLKSFSDALTESVQSVNQDKHMRIRPVPPRKAEPNTPERMTEDILRNIERRRENGAGFSEVKRLEGNIGYLDLRGFAGPERGIPLADSYMNLISDSDAIIIDLRKNGGGSPRMVQYLCSYFFDQHIHLNSLYWREGDSTEEFWTLDEIGGKKLPDVPLFILTSSYTFSGAEEFSYNMQTQKRATLVGETTGGGANPGGRMPINEKLYVFIPTGKAINPITKTNWEGTGVEPEIKTSSEEAFDKGYELAKAAAENYRNKKRVEYSSSLSDMQSSLSNYKPGQQYQTVFEKINKCQKSGLLGEGEINQLGYDYIMQYNNPQVAEIIFKVNTELYPNSANVYDSYGEALAMNGKKEKSIHAYEKAVQIAEENNDPNLELFKTNLKKIQGIKIKP